MSAVDGGEGAPKYGTDDDSPGSERSNRSGLVRVSSEFRLRRGLRKLGHFGQPMKVLEFLAAARRRGDAISLRVFNVALAAVASCEGSCRYALKLLVLMEEEGISPDRFSLTAVVADCCRCQEWELARGVLTEMHRRGLQPLDMRTSRFTTVPGETSASRDNVLRALEDARSNPMPERNDCRCDGNNEEEGEEGTRNIKGRTKFEVLNARHGVDHGLASAYYGGLEIERLSYGKLDGGSATEEDSSVQGADVRITGQRKRDSGVSVVETEGGEAKQGSARHAIPATMESSARAGEDLYSAVDSSVAIGGVNITRSVEDFQAAGVRPSQHVFLSELKAAAVTKDAAGALRLLDGMRAAGYPPHQGAYACAIRACGKAGKWEHSLSLLDEMRQAGVEPGEGCHIMALKACGNAGRWERVLELLEAMKGLGVGRSESSFAVAMKACGEAGRWREAIGILEEMRRDGVPPMETAYTTAMKACDLAGEWEQALALLNEMRGMGIPASELCFTAAIKSCANADETEKALLLLREMRAAPGVATNMASYRSIVHALCKAGDWASAVGLLEDARREHLKPTTGDLRVVVQACGQAAQYDRALSLLEEMRSEGMGMRRTGEKLWWLFKDCPDAKIAERAWSLMEIDAARVRLEQKVRRTPKTSINNSSINVALDSAPSVATFASDRCEGTPV